MSKLSKLSEQLEIVAQSMKESDYDSFIKRMILIATQHELKPAEYVKIGIKIQTLFTLCSENRPSFS